MIKRNEDEYNNLLVTLGDIIDLILLAQKNEYDKVTIRAQVIKISDPAKVGKGLTKQEFTIGCTCSRSTGRIHSNNYPHR